MNSNRRISKNDDGSCNSLYLILDAEVEREYACDMLSWRLHEHILETTDVVECYCDATALQLTAFGHCHSQESFAESLIPF